MLFAEECAQLVHERTTANQVKFVLLLIQRILQRNEDASDMGESTMASNLEMRAKFRRWRAAAEGGPPTSAKSLGVTSWVWRR
jgi:hypothetical protein